MPTNNIKTPVHYLWAWFVHLFTASAAFFGVLALQAIYHHQYVLAFWFMGVTVFIDAIDGTMARHAHVKTLLPGFDGALLDNIVDYFNYAIVPAFFLLVKPDMLPAGYASWVILAITITSAYQFCQVDAKTPDHFFKGFPTYWNFAVFYLFLFDTTATTNALVLLVLSVLIFIPIKYVYPSRIDFLTHSKPLKRLMHGASTLFAISSALILWGYPEKNRLWLGLSFGYVVLYLFLSIYRTLSPLKEA